MLTCCCGSAVFGQAAKPSLVAAPLELDPNPSLTRFEPQLKAAFFATLEDRSGTLLLSMKEAELAKKNARRDDFRTSDESLKRFAQEARVLYALFAVLEYTPRKQLVLTGRVVRDDGKMMKAAQIQLSKGEDTIVELMKPLTMQLIAQLELATLPNFKEASPDPVKEPVKEPGKDPVKETIKDFPPPPPPPLVDTGAGQRIAGKGLLFAGAGVALVGGVLAGVGAGVGYGLSLEQQEVPASRLQAINTARALTSVGFVGAGVGAASAVVGAILLGTAPPPVSRVSVVPIVGGGVVQFGGQF